METDNLEELKEVMYRKGFGTDHSGELEEKLNSGEPVFTIEHDEKVKEDLAAYDINFSRGGEQNKAYLNSFDIAYYENGDTTKEPRIQNFPAKFLVTAAEAFRMVKHGTNVAVHKTLYNKNHEKYNTWMSVDTGAPKDEYGNYPLKTFHQNYYGSDPFDVKDAMKQLQTPVKELEFPMQRENAEKALKKGNILEVTILHNGAEQKGYLTVDPQHAGLKLWDRHPDHREAVVIEAIARPKQQQSNKQDPHNQAPDQKKKFDQRVSQGKRNQSRGFRP
ncbi:hypothetical protein AB6805_13510 [Chitinophaga sp. RCC_12]|uniref:hypothetical protein n=1 Tax=Chitinophaga sp. RCC_12 TaxID=3239226 RepID=UPI00352642E5